MHLSLFPYDLFSSSLKSMKALLNILYMQTYTFLTNLVLTCPMSSNDSSCLVLSTPDMIHEYFGGTVAFYFSFLDFYTWSLLPPAILGLVLTMFSGTIVTYSSAATFDAIFLYLLSGK